jgi:hypothetical protein
MAALLNPINHGRGGIKWGLVVYTAAMFVFVTIGISMDLHLLPFSYIDNREFPGDDEVLVFPGPLGYRIFLTSKMIGVFPNIMGLINSWLADGLLVSSVSIQSPRCLTPAVPTALSLLRHLFRELLGRRHPLPDVPGHFGYVFESPTASGSTLLMFIDTVMGALLTYHWALQSRGPQWTSVIAHFGLPYFSICLSLNILLTAMIVTRLVLYSRDVRKAMGSSAGANGLYKAVITMLIESSALYTAGSLLFFLPWAANDSTATIFSLLLADIEVRTGFTFPHPPQS